MTETRKYSKDHDEAIRALAMSVYELKLHTWKKNRKKYNNASMNANLIIRSKPYAKKFVTGVNFLYQKDLIERKNLEFGSQYYCDMLKSIDCENEEDFKKIYKETPLILRLVGGTTTKRMYYNKKYRKGSERAYERIEPELFTLDLCSVDRFNIVKDKKKWKHITGMAKFVDETAKPYRTYGIGTEKYDYSAISDKVCLEERIVRYILDSVDNTFIREFESRPKKPRKLRVIKEAEPW